MNNFSKKPYRSVAPWVLGLGLSLTSCVSWAQNVVIGSLVSSQVSKVYVQEGQQVKAGQKLMDLDASRYYAKLKSLQAKAKLAHANLDDAQIELDQAQDLFDRTVSTRRALDAAKLAFSVAKAQAEDADAQVLMHKAWHKYLYIKAPISGKISKIHAPAGTTVFKENTPMIELAPN